MSRALSVKVATPKVIKALEDKLEAGTKAVANNEKKRKEFEKVEKAWAKEVADLIVKQIAKADVSASENWRGEVSVRIEVPAGTIKLPTQPQIELESELGRYEVQEIENAIRILKMTDEETVNASTFKTIAQYL
jgi:membrane-associated protease RseP (regulator of RpoE activity)